MRIGVPKEIKDQENRVGLTPSSVHELTARNHEVYVEQHAGDSSGFCEESYRLAGATILPSAEEVFEVADLIVKVKEPQPEECKRLKEDQILFTFLHLAPDPIQAELLIRSGCTAIAYETVTDEQKSLPLLTPMSEIAGRFSIQAGAHCLEKSQGGRGMLLGGVPGVAPASVVILGGGVAGTEALRVALGMGASVTVLDKSLKRLRELETQFSGRMITSYASRDNVEQWVVMADLVVGAVLIPGATAPKVVTRAMIQKMNKGSVIVDVSIDQGGCFETSRPTTHSSPTFIDEGVVHYCVGNMTGAVPLTATLALNNATLPYVCLLADKGYRQACKENPFLRKGMNVCNGRITHPAVAEALKIPYTSAESMLDVLSTQV